MRVARAAAWASSWRGRLRPVQLRLVLRTRAQIPVIKCMQFLEPARVETLEQRILQKLFLIGDPLDHLGNVKTVFVVQATADIREPDNFIPGFGHQIGGHRTNVAKSLDNRAAALLFHI